MVDVYRDDCEVVKDSLKGARSVDEQTFASVAALNERLQRVKKMGPKFSIVEFSPAVKHLRSRSNKLAVV